MISAVYLQVVQGEKINAHTLTGSHTHRLTHRGETHAASVGSWWRAPGCSLEGMMLKLKLQYFGHLMRRVDSLEKTLLLEGIGGRRRRG